MALIPEMTIVEFRKLKAEQIKEMKSVIVTANGERLFTCIIAPLNAGTAITDKINAEAEYLGMSGNTVGGKEPAEVINAAVSV